MKTGYFKNKRLKITVALLLCFLMSFGTIMPMAQLSYAAGDEDKRVEKQAEQEGKIENSDNKELDETITEDTGEGKADSADGSGKENSDSKEGLAEPEKGKAIKRSLNSKSAPVPVDGIVTTTLEHGILHSNGHDIVSPITISDGEELTVTQAEKIIKLTINVKKDVNGNIITHKDVSIKIPRGLDLVKATGVASVDKTKTAGTYEKGEYTPTEQLYLTSYDGNEVKYPIWQAEQRLYDGDTQRDYDTNNTSGTLTYSFSDGVSDGTVEVYLRANPYFAQPASNVGAVETLFNDITVEVKGEDRDGEPVVDSDSFGLKFKSDGTWYHTFSISSGESGSYYVGSKVPYNLWLNPTRNNAFGKNVNTTVVVTNLRCDVTYPKGAVFYAPSNYTVTSETEVGNNVIVHLTSKATQSWTLNNNTEVASFTDGKPNGVRSEHEVTVTALANPDVVDDEDEQMFTGKTGKTFTKLTSMNVDPVTVNTMAIAGTNKRVTFNVRGGGYTGGTFAIVLPEGITLENLYVSALRNDTGYGTVSNQRLDKDTDGATMVKLSERPATAEEIARTFGTGNESERAVTEATVYYYSIFDQGIYLKNENRNGGAGVRNICMSYEVNAVIHTEATYQAAEYSFDKLVYLGTNVEGATLGRHTGGGPFWATDDTHRSMGNFLNLGVSTNIITGHSGSYLRIEKSPALIVEERIKDSESEYMYYDGDEKNIARFGPDEEGKIRVKITNTVNIGAWQSVNNYIFIPLPKKDQQILSTEQKVDMKYTGPLTLTDGDYDEATCEVKYISNASYSTIEVANAEQVYSNGADTVSDDTNLIAVKVTGLKPTGDMVFEVPIKAPNHIQQDEIFNQMGSVSIYVFSGDGTDNSYATYRCTEKENPLRLSYRYPEWELTFQNVRDNGDGTVTDLSNPVIDRITHVRDQDPVLKHGTAGDYPTYQSLPEDPTLASHNFEGYYLDKAFTEPFVPFDGTNIDEATRITEDTTIYVKWVEVPCELTVSKFIANLDGDGAYANLNDEFTLTINLRAADGSASRYTTFEYTGDAMAGVDKPADGTLTLDSDGNATINIKHGQSIKIKGILRDQLVTVTETEKNNYKKPTVSITGKQDATAYTTGSFALEEGETTVKFSNNYTSVTPTGIGSASKIFTYIITGLIMIAAALYLIRRKFI